MTCAEVLLIALCRGIIKLRTATDWPNVMPQHIEPIRLKPLRSGHIREYWPVRMKHYLNVVK